MSDSKIPQEKAAEESLRGTGWRPRLADALRGRHPAEVTAAGEPAAEEPVPSSRCGAARRRSR